MSGRLLLITPTIGHASETFIRRHVETLAPGRTSLITVSRVDGRSWDVPSGMPVLELGKTRPAIVARACRKAQHLIGLSPEEPTEAAIRKFIEQAGVDVALSEWMHVSLPYYSACRSLRIPFFAHAHGLDMTLKRLSDPACQREYRSYADAAGVITVSNLQKTRLVGMVGMPAEKIHVNYLGVDVPSAMPERRARDTITCVAVGRMVAKKSPLATLQAFERAYRRDLRLRLEYIGDGPLFDAAKRYSADYGLDGVVEFLGAQPGDVTLRRLRAADIFLLHSVVDPDTGDEEGLPVVILEAMASGVPVVSTRHGGIPEAVAHGETGFLVSEHDVESMAEHILMLSKDEHLRLAFGHSGWQVAHERFDAEKSVANLRGLLGLNL